MVGINEEYLGMVEIIEEYSGIVGINEEYPGMVGINEEYPGMVSNRFKSFVIRLSSRLENIVAGNHKLKLSVLFSVKDTFQIKCCCCFSCLLRSKLSLINNLFGLVRLGWVKWHINHWRLFNVKFCLHTHIYIVIHRQTVSFYQDSSEWQDTQDARSRDRNPSNFTLD